MLPSRPPFPLMSWYGRVKERVATYRHGWFRAVVWFLFGAMVLVLFPAMVAAWFWRLSYRPPPQGGRRLSMLLLAVMAGLFQLLWLNALIIDPMAGIGEALNQPSESAAEGGPIAADAPPTAEGEPDDPTDESQGQVSEDEEQVAEPTTTSTISEPATTTTAAVTTTAATTTTTLPPLTTTTAAVTTTTLPPTTTTVAPTTTTRTTTTTTTLPPPTNQPTAATGVLSGLAVAAESNGGVSYDRDLYGSWRQVRSGCNTRCLVLEDESRSDGTWLSWYDGMVISNSSQLDIDHMVPLAEAHSSGGWQWSSSRRRNFANDLVRPQALAAVSASSNRSKGARDPAEWRPPQRSAWCRYATDWITVKIAWGLTADRAEVDALEEMLDTCGSQVTLTTTAPAPTAAIPQTTTAALVATVSCPYTSQAGDPCGAVPALGNQSNDVNCGDVPSRFKPLTVVGQDYDRLDGNNDGAACTS